jgi:hypothetical protein
MARMERMMNTNQRVVKLKELTETIEKTHRECEEPTSVDMKTCQETTACQDAILGQSRKNGAKSRRPQWSGRIFLTKR